MVPMLRPLVMLFVILTFVTGIAYPLLVTGIGKLAFPEQAAGSLVIRDHKAVGSSLIGQSFQDPKYFWGRLSATAPVANNGTASGGSNFAPTNPALLDAVKGRIGALKATDPTNVLPIPVDLVTASASGLDPEISPAAALYQATRVARVRNLDPVELRRRVLSKIQGPQWGVFGESRVNVLQLNLDLDAVR